MVNHGRAESWKTLATSKTNSWSYRVGADKDKGASKGQQLGGASSTWRAEALPCTVCHQVNDLRTASGVSTWEFVCHSVGGCRLCYHAVDNDRNHQLTRHVWNAGSGCTIKQTVSGHAAFTMSSVLVFVCPYSRTTVMAAATTKGRMERRAARTPKVTMYTT